MEFIKGRNGLKHKLYTVMSVCTAAAMLLSGCFFEPQEISEESSGEVSSAGVPDNTALALYEKDAPALVEPVDIVGAVSLQPAEAVPYTILVMMNGSDLESDGGMATSDLTEMIDSKFNEQKINLLVLTGGTNTWQNDFISPGYGLYKYTAGSFEQIADLGDQSIGDPALLAGLINFGYEQFPAERYGLILWDHGGGSVLGYGSDEITGDSLLLSELETAMASSDAAKRPLEFVGFDACLMGNIETACILSGYANYLIGSEELEPGYGWDYNFLSKLSQNPAMTGKDLGKYIADYFNSFYTTNLPDEQITLSVTNLNTVGAAAKAFEEFAVAANTALTKGEYNTIAKKRGGTKAFGDMSAHGGETDMVDIKHLAQQMKDIVPQQSQALIDALKQSLVYSVSYNVDNAGGLSVYFPFACKEYAKEYVKTYQDTGILPAYTGFVSQFANILTGNELAEIDVSAVTPQETPNDDYQIVLSQEEIENIYAIYFTVWQKEENVANGADYYIQLGENSNVTIAEDGTVVTDFDGNWTALNGNWACLYEIDSGSSGTRYAIPARLNGEDVDLIALYNNENPNGKIIGAIPTSSDTYDMPARQMLQVKDGDKLALYYYSELFTDEDVQVDENTETQVWYEGDEFTVKGGLQLEVYEADDGEYLYGFTIVDTQMNTYYTDFISVEIGPNS